MFKVEEKPFGKYKMYYLKNTANGEFVSVVPAFGAVLNQVALSKDEKVYELLDGSTSYEELITEGRNKFKGSKLFPFPNRILDGQYSFENNIYNIPINFLKEKHAIHGLVLDSNFEVMQKLSSLEKAQIILRYQTSGMEKGYPFKIKITIEYCLSKNGFTCITSVENMDTKNIPVGDGWHPYFKTNSKIDDCLLTLPVEYSYEVDSRMIPTGKTIKETVFINPTKISDTKFDTCYKLAKTGNPRLYTKIEDPSHNLSLLIWQSTGEGNYNYLQVYTPPNRQSIAIEPMTCLANAYNNGEGLIVLKPSEKRNFSFGIILE